MNFYTTDKGELTPNLKVSLVFIPASRSCFSSRQIRKYLPQFNSNTYAIKSQIYSWDLANNKNEDNGQDYFSQSYF